MFANRSNFIYYLFKVFAEFFSESYFSFIVIKFFLLVWAVIDWLRCISRPWKNISFVYWVTNTNHFILTEPKNSKLLILILIPPIDHGSDLLFLERVSSTYPTLDGLVTGKGLLTGARLVLRMMRLARYAISDYFYIITREKYWPCFFIH